MVQQFNRADAASWCGLIHSSGCKAKRDTSSVQSVVRCSAKGQMINRVLFVSQRQAVAMNPPDAAVLISITDFNKPQVSFKEGWGQILRVSFDDVDLLTFPSADSHLHNISALQVAEICGFAASISKETRRIIVHCRHGISRSAAVAKAIAEAAEMNFPADYQEYNHFVFEALRGPLKSAFQHA